jgi:hypothetical protein
LGIRKGGLCVVFLKHTGLFSGLNHRAQACYLTSNLPLTFDTFIIRVNANLGIYSFYKVNMKFSKAVFLTVATATLVACGGGGGSSSPAAADVVDKYVGTWVACVARSAPSTGAYKESVTYTKTGPSAVSFAFKQESFASADCTGTPTATPFSQSGTAVLKGTKVVGADTVDKFEETITSVPTSLNKEIAFISGNALKLSDTSSTNFDADGYPTVLDNVYVYIKQGNISVALQTGYSGTWLGTCRQNTSFSIGGAFGYAVGTITFNSASATNVSGSTSNKIYSNANCTGTPLATNGRNFSFTIDGTTVIDGKNVDKVTQTLSAYDSNMSSAAVTINGVSYVANYFTRVDVFKDISVIVDNQLFSGVGASPGADYPTALRTTPSATRQ